MGSVQAACLLYPSPPSPYAVYTRIFSPSHTSTFGGNVKLFLCTSSFITDTDMEEVSHIDSMTEQAASSTYFISLSSYAIYIRRTLSPLHTFTIG
jgi:hypothetical protein